VLVVADGRRPGYSVGLDFVEEARVMRALGARDAVNLDGGGSTGITIGAQLVNRLIPRESARSEMPWY
jgi:exopolysaccharide biosynthesis protein